MPDSTTYTPNGQQKTVADANGNLTTYTYDAFDRLIAWAFPSKTIAGSSAGCTIGTVSASTITWPDGTTTTATGPATTESAGDDCEKYFYDNSGNRVQLVKRDGSILDFEPDALNEVIFKSVPQRSGLPATDARSVYYSFDLVGHELTARFDNATGEGVTNAYDGFGRITASTLAMDGISHTLSYHYDLDNNRTSVTFPDGNSASYAYDGLDRASNIMRTGGATVAAYTYNNNGQRTGFNNNTTPSSATVATSYGYDTASRLSSLATSIANAGAGVNGSFGFTYNPANEIATLTKSANAFVFTGAYNVNRGYGVNGQNQYTTAGSAAFTYDANGNLYTDGTNTYVYDIENRLVNVSGANNAAIRYNPLGRIYEVAGQNTATRFLYGGDELMAEYDSGGNLLRRYIHGADLSTDDPVAWYEGSAFGSGNERFLRPDWQGSIALITDNAGQAVFATNTFDDYGIPGAGNIGRFQYTGQAWIPEIGMYYYKARMYSPTLGRFMQTDPIGYKDQMNLYEYVGDEPIDGTDFSGNEKVRHDIVAYPGSRILHSVCVSGCGSGSGGSGSGQGGSGRASAAGSRSAQGNANLKGSDAVGYVGLVHAGITEAAKAQAGNAAGAAAGIRILNGSNAIVTAVGAMLDRQEQIKDGKSGDRATANAFGHAAGVALVTGSAVAALPEELTVGAVVVVGGAADRWLGPTMGNLAEKFYRSVYNATNNSAALQANHSEGGL